MNPSSVVAAALTPGPAPANLTPEAMAFLATTKVMVARTVSDGEGKVQTAVDLPQTIEVHRFVTQPCAVYVQDEVKKGKNYSSAGYTIGVLKFCYAEEIEAAKEWANNFVHTAIFEQMPEVIKLVDKLGEGR